MDMIQNQFILMPHSIIAIKLVDVKLLLSYMVF